MIGCTSAAFATVITLLLRAVVDIASTPVHGGHLYDRDNLRSPNFLDHDKYISDIVFIFRICQHTYSMDRKSYCREENFMKTKKKLGKNDQNFHELRLVWRNTINSLPWLQIKKKIQFKNSIYLYEFNLPT